MIYHRSSSGVNDDKEGTLLGISTLYHYEYQCDCMLLEDEELNEGTVAELRMVTSMLQEGDVVRKRAAGEGARLLSGEEHKDFDTVVRLEKEVKSIDVKDQKEQTVKDTTVRVVVESGVMMCRFDHHFESDHHFTG